MIYQFLGQDASFPFNLNTETLIKTWKKNSICYYMAVFLSHLFVTICYRRVDPVTTINNIAYYELRLISMRSHFQPECFYKTVGSIYLCFSWHVDQNCNYRYCYCCYTGECNNQWYHLIWFFQSSWKWRQKEKKVVQKLIETDTCILL